VIDYFNLFSNKNTATRTVKDDFVPSSIVSSHIVEEVVGDLTDSKDKLNRRGILNLPYEQLSFIEKVNYEIHYAKNIFDLLSRAAFSGIDFNSVQVSSFKSLQGVGICSSKDHVIQFFKALKKEKIELFPKPKTQIRKSGAGYKFTIDSNTKFGLNLEAPFLLGPEDILTYKDLSVTVNNMVNAAQESGLHLQSEPRQKEAFFVGDYRRFRYRISGTSSYNAFISFVNSLYARHIPCAFEELKLTALNNASVQIEADIIFTTSH